MEEISVWSCRAKKRYFCRVSCWETSIFPCEFRVMNYRAATFIWWLFPAITLVLSRTIWLGCCFFIFPPGNFYPDNFCHLLLKRREGCESGLDGRADIVFGEVGRVYSFRNAIALTAFFMVMFNPYVLLRPRFSPSFMALLKRYLRPLVG